ncbi:hypothetical protein L2750_13090 [Shewanella submarina]|uniref:Fibronectin type-III domain-containing protein n=1 Tax=Shewanella submarina TaxID=2016376 RepID=A0ABV7GHI6_9GAMM|nr:hypothetical protein [Shewanella submarina]MCL1038085.1 hypothetical protein [Shewanella submarina]
MANDPSTFFGLGYTGRQQHYVYDRRSDSWGTIYGYVFNLKFSDGTQTDAVVSPEFGSQENAREKANEYAFYLGQQPKSIRDGVQRLIIFDGDAKWGGLNGDVMVHTVHGKALIKKGTLEETLFHEAIHATFETGHKNHPDWHEAQKADGISITKYGQNYPVREDFAETFLMYFVSRYMTDRVTDSVLDTVNTLIPNRLAYLDSQNFDLSPYTPNSTSHAATLTSHGPEVEIETKSVTLSWNRPEGTHAYRLDVGTTGIGSDNILASDLLYQDQSEVTNLPDEYAAVYVRLWSAHWSGSWEYRDYRFISPNLDNSRLTANLTRPRHGNQLTGVRQTFYWDNPPLASHYDLLLGSSKGGNDILSSNVQKASDYSFQYRDVFGLPSDGRDVFARLWTYTDSWNYQDYVIEAINDPEVVSILSPAQDTQLASSSVVFDLEKPYVDSEYSYDLIVGTQGVHSNDIRVSSVTSDESVLVNGLPVDGRTVYLTLWTKKGELPWSYKTYSYEAVDAVISTAHFDNYSEETPPLLESTKVLFEWRKPDVNHEHELYLYDLLVGSTPWSSDIRSSSTTTNQSLLVEGLPKDGSKVYITFWTKVGEQPWASKQYIYQTPKTNEVDNP